ncbi:FAD-dependent oxidoreductase [Humisphaera borealis]|uniref:FAD-dependent oxidoreductase n=1 Tax=Humisphaera borealis TaxID=2807512 RepID=A0A7M2WYM5_9BACT|nr:FAD-dependent oxidoreductase [Humisphaera borealis]
MPHVEQLAACDATGTRRQPCLRFGRQARFQPLIFMGELAGRLSAMGVRVHTHTFVNELATVKGSVKASTSDGFEVTARFGLAATNVPSVINNWAGIYTKFAAYRTYMVGLEVPAGAIADGLYWDMLDPYHYARLEQGQGGGEPAILLVGGEDHKTGQHDHRPDQEQRFARLEQWARENFDGVGRLAWRWSGQVNEPDDGVAFIGAVPTADNEHCYVITGDSGMGLTHGVLGAKLVTDLITGVESPWAELYRPQRKPLSSPGTFLSENLNAVAQYAALLTPGEVSSVDDIAVDCGAILRKGLTKVAAYRDKEGQIHQCSALCTHQQGVVVWNDVEKSWDCPVHGSRFCPEGRVLTGPAVEPLPPLAEP